MKTNSPADGEITVTLIPDIRDSKAWRYVPQELMTIQGWSSVAKYCYVPKGARKQGDGPIRQDMGMLVVYCANDNRRYYGFEDARINSELRMTVRLSDFHLRDEVIRKWEVCTTV